MERQLLSASGLEESQAITFLGTYTMNVRFFLQAVLKTGCCLVLFTVSGCSNMYEGLKASRQEDCYRLSYPDQQECLRETDVSYEEYEKERKSG